jgi:hypothetical protein
MSAEVNAHQEVRGPNPTSCRLSSVEVSLVQEGEQRWNLRREEILVIGITCLQEKLPTVRVFHSIPCHLELDIPEVSREESLIHNLQEFLLSLPIEHLASYVAVAVHPNLRRLICSEKGV